MQGKRLGGRNRRHLRIRNRIRGVTERPRLVVFRSNQHIYAQIVDDTSGETLIGVHGSAERIVNKIKGDQERFAESRAVGEEIALKAKEKGIEKIVFDRAGYRYHGRVKALADAVRKAGLDF
jgi:large subunit ribosomal protein L18